MLFSADSTAPAGDAGRRSARASQPSPEKKGRRREGEGERGEGRENVASPPYFFLAGCSTSSSGLASASASAFFSFPEPARARERTCCDMSRWERGCSCRGR